MQGSMAKVTMATVLQEVRNLGTRLHALDAKVDVRFDFLKEQIQRVDAKVDNLESKFDDLESKFDDLETKFDDLETKVDRIASDLKVVRDQTAHVTERVAALEPIRPLRT
jgi:archaellum component FlaC